MNCYCTALKVIGSLLITCAWHLYKPTRSLLSFIENAVRHGLPDALETRHCCAVLPDEECSQLQSKDIRDCKMKLAF